MNKVVITGATSMLGVALIKNCILNNTYVLAIVRNNSKNAERIPKSKYVSVLECDLDKIETLDVSNLDNDYEVFYHFAWNGTNAKDRNNPTVQENNIRYSISAVQLAKKLGCKMFVGSGSQAEYGITSTKISSNTPTFPESSYGCAKLCAGQLTKIECNNLGINHIWVRITSLYGEDDGNITFMSQLLEGLKNNDDINCTKCEQIWDYLHYDDAANAFYKIGESNINDRVYVLGSGKEIPLKSYVEEAKTVLKSHSIINYGKIPYTDKQVMYLCADISDLMRDIDWKPETEFKDFIKKYNGDCKNEKNK